MRTSASQKLTPAHTPSSVQFAHGFRVSPDTLAAIAALNFALPTTLAGMIKNMKHTYAAIAAACTVVFLTCAPRAEAGGRGTRSDLPCPYGGAGPVNPTLWSPITPTPPSPFNPGAPTANYAALVAGSNITTDSGQGGGLDIIGATQYDWYANPLPAVSTCSDPNAIIAGPIEQVIDYKLTAGGSLNLASGDTEVQFNYDPSVDSTKGVASFTMDGVTFTSTGPLLPTGTDNTFLFSASGALLGALTLDPNSGDTILTAGVPSGWTESGGTVSAPEIDPSTAIAALSLLAGGLAILRGRRSPLIRLR